MAQMSIDVVQAMPPLTGRDLKHRIKEIRGLNGNVVKLYITSPGGDGPFPCIYHVHGGGMAFSTTAMPIYNRFRDELAQRGAIVVAVEFRNSAGDLGPFPFPAGLDDVSAGMKWCLENRYAKISQIPCGSGGKKLL